MWGLVRASKGEKRHMKYIRTPEGDRDGEIDLQNVPRTNESNTRFTPQRSNQCLRLSLTPDPSPMFILTRKLCEPSRGTWLCTLLPSASSVLYNDADTLLALWFEKSGTSGVLEDFADTLTSAGGALEVHPGTNFLCDGLTLKEGRESHLACWE